MRWLVTGAGGMLGRDTVEELTRRGEDVTGLDHKALDITQRDAVEGALADHRPDLVVNCAAYTAVDDAESDEERALRINGDGPGHLARACAAHGARMIHVSTDYVFAGDARTPYPEDHPTAPRTAYGRTKLAGEQAVAKELPTSSAIVRTAWLYGVHGRSFVRTMIDLESRRDTLDVVHDQRGQPTWSADVAVRLADLGPHLGRGASGVFHATGSGEASWYELAREVFSGLGADPGRVRPVGSEAFPRPAPRPAYSALAHGRWQELGLPPLRDWQAALREALPLIRKESLRETP
ncbi:dTDP-4-dehydrorhamnose reductase [Streptomyces spinosirectus]|jgi:dTDP-4-dehydrorhamnose reductase/4-ketoreductase|uniref:dTDP-4-dehydrorhamnose reductase n=1 Tax=Streptomyces TaxID=1883 RepID=UPI000D34B2D3|nr:MULTISPECIES: dTDP-4-dehydrorhamnose reductase [Streptomyces]MBY8343578.1 dTDP-4-dehydrorhamnose reductase [Streptomyces plumbidurans]PTM85738.1 dTDP-4-dehydrorhamnose reductase [Streptomyces sp. VMFN-G11Ma]UIR22136.1 dTDP-4-dehydrorhamnose reductase [Streptomyces spinosirectus]